MNFRVLMVFCVFLSFSYVTKGFSSFAASEDENTGAGKPKRILVVIDVQNDFLLGGSLAVPNGNDVMPIINHLILTESFDGVLATKDFHPRDHISFAKNDSELFKTVSIDYSDLNKGCVEQIQWPAHCVQESFGSEFHMDLKADKIMKVFHKGTNKRFDSYSGFFDNLHQSNTGLDSYIRENFGGNAELYIVGLAYDFCVKYTALDAVALGYETFVVEDATRAVYPENTADIRKYLQQKGITVLLSSDLGCVDIS